MSIIRRVQWTEQPQDAVGLTADAANLQCVVASLGSARGYNSAANTLPRSIGSDVSFAPTQYGLSQRGSTTGGGVAYGTGGFNTLVPVASEWTIMLLVRVVTLGTRSIILGDFSSGGINESVFIEQTSTNTWRGGWVTTAPTTRQVNAGTVTTGWHWVEWQSAAAASTLWVDGEVIGTTTGTSTRRAGTDYRVGMPGALASIGFSGDIAAHFVFASALDEGTRSKIRKNPWQLFTSRRILVPQAVAGSGYSITAQPGSYSVTGQTASLYSNKLISADAGSYSLSGQDATITYTPSGTNYTITANSGTYSITGQAATILRSKQIVASAGSYTLTGQNATINYSTGSGITTLKAGSWIRYRIIT